MTLAVTELRNEGKNNRPSTVTDGGVVFAVSQVGLDQAVAHDCNLKGLILGGLVIPPKHAKKQLPIK